MNELPLQTPANLTLPAANVSAAVASAANADGSVDIVVASEQVRVEQRRRAGLSDDGGWPLDAYYCSLVPFARWRST